MTMKMQDIPMIPNRKASLPRIYGDTPTFLGTPIATSPADIRKADVVIMGVPWEGTITWGTYSGCELAPKAIRHAAARYGGYLPEYDIDSLSVLKVADAGDVQIDPSSPSRTMAMVRAKAAEIYGGKAVPITFGGDHSFTPAIIEALSDHVKGNIGIVHFDAHLDNMKSFNKEDAFPRCGPIYRLAQLPKVKTANIVQIGIRGPRNAPSEGAFAKKIGATVFTIRDIRRLGMDKTVERAIDIAYRGAEAVYVTVCSDVIDAAYNPGGPIDFDGLAPHDLFSALYALGEKGIAGLDFVEIYPLSDRNNVSAHLAAWAVVYALVGMAAGRKARTR